jgi:AcrR family transcriptional regulator
VTQAPSPSAAAPTGQVPPAGVTSSTAPTRRDRLRAATTEEITATARRLLVEQGPDAMSLRAIAREMGMTAPGLYRYYSSREELLRHVIATIFRELSGDIRRAISEVSLSTLGTAVTRGGASPGDVRRHITLKMVAACREFRRWALSHKDEFTLLFGVPVPGIDEAKHDVAEECALEFAGTFYVLFIELWNLIHFPVPDPAEIDEGLRAQLDRFRTALNSDAPDGALLVFLRCWILLYGAVSMEVFGHLGFALDDPAPMFEYTLADLARMVGLEYPLPAS